MSPEDKAKWRAHFADVKVVPYMAYNHNGTPLMSKPASQVQALAELRKYEAATGNPGGYIEEVKS